MKITKNLRVDVELWPFAQDCRQHGAPSRVYINTRLWHVYVRTGLPYRGFETVLRYTGTNRAGNEARWYEVLGRRWEREAPGVVRIRRE